MMNANTHPNASVSVPLRGKEGTGPLAPLAPKPTQPPAVSVPLRGKEGAGPKHVFNLITYRRYMFPSPCGVRRVRDPWFLETLYDAVFKVRF